jgi:branched-chain amino acid aminotransferase
MSQSSSQSHPSSAPAAPEPSPHPARVKPALPAPGNLKFGTVFTDQMMVATYDSGRGWQPAQLVPFGPLALSPAAAGLHYGQAMFEGLKAFRGVDGQVRIFRLDRHCRRMARGAARLCMPALDPAVMARAIVEYVRDQRHWVPQAPGTALYLRPTLFASEPFLGVRPAEQYLFFIIGSPVAGYFGDGGGTPRPLRLRVEEKMVRAAPGGLGAVKAAGNYAASLKAAHDARQAGYDQVLWTDAHSHLAIEEAGTMNVFAHLGEEIVTPPLDGTLLAGITRESVITLLRDLDLPVKERRITMDQLLEARRTGQLHEMWGTGTGASVVAIGELGWRDERIVVGDGGEGPLARRLLPRLQEIQTGATPDHHHWMTIV